MTFLLILAMCSLAAAKATVQGKASRGLISNDADAVFFNAGIFLTSCAIFSWKIIGCLPQVWIYGAIIAVLTVIFQLFYTKALKAGSVSLTVLIINLAMIIPTLFSFVFYGDSLSVLRIIGIVLTVLSFILATETEGASFNKKWFAFALIASLSSGAMSVVQKVFNTSNLATQKEAFISSSYVLAFLLCLLVLAVFRKKGIVRTTKLNKRYLFSVIGIGAILALHGWATNFGLSFIEGTLLFPLSSGGTILLSTLAGIVFFRDKLSVKQLIGVLVGITAVVLMNF